MDFEISEQKKIDVGGANCRFIRVTLGSVKEVLERVFEYLQDLSWLDRLDQTYLQESFRLCAQKTLEAIVAEFALEGNVSQITKDAGEYVVSVAATNVLESSLGYPALPLAELIDKKAKGNPGFDFHNENPEKFIVIFGEAKYRSTGNAYGAALKQIVDFIEEKKDIQDLTSISHFCSEASSRNVEKRIRGFAAAFSTKSTKSETILKGIMRNDHFQAISQHEEVLLVAVDL